MHSARRLPSLASANPMAMARRVSRVLRDVCAGAIDSDAYPRYLAHQQLHHPDVAPQSREAFFREHATARWNGITRCC
jgi:uncharacterized short protein YbdD (DUF466 family)